MTKLQNEQGMNFCLSLDRMDFLDGRFVLKSPSTNMMFTELFLTLLAPAASDLQLFKSEILVFPIIGLAE